MAAVQHYFEFHVKKCMSNLRGAYTWIGAVRHLYTVQVQNTVVLSKTYLHRSNWNFTPKLLFTQHYKSAHLVRSTQLSREHCIISLFFFAYNLCKFCCCSPHKPALHHFHSISTSSQFVRTDSCLLLRRRQSENIEPAHSTKRQHHQHNSDSSEKVLDEQSPRSAFNFSSNISGARKKKERK